MKSLTEYKYVSFAIFIFVLVDVGGPILALDYIQGWGLNW